MIRWERKLVVAALVVAVAGIAFGYALVRALTLAPVQEPTQSKTEKPDSAKVETTESGKKAALTRTDLMLAVDHDPFQPDRQRPPERYRMPGEDLPMEEEAPPPPPPPPPPFRVLGTIATGNGGVAVIESQGSISRVVGVGEALFGFKLTAVNNNTATVEGNGGHTYSLAIEQPSMTRTPPGRAGRAGRGTSSPQEALRRQMEARETMLRDLMERARSSGATPGQMEQLVQEMLRRNFPAQGIGSVELGRGANGQQQIIIRPRADTMRELSRVPDRSR